MKIGTKSVLFGAHCFAIHWFFVALGWWKLYGFKAVYIGTNTGYPQTLRWKLGVRGGPQFARFLDPRLWLVFLLHDIGYLGKPNMDGPEGEEHPWTGARIIGFLFGTAWHDFTLLHSRFLAKRYGRKPSPLCIADKLAIALEPWWFYLPRVNLTGEVAEYMAKSSAMNATGSKYSGMNLNVASQRAWVADMQAYIRRWVAEHRDGREDTWTPNTKGETVTDSGVLR